MSKRRIYSGTGVNEFLMGFNGKGYFQEKIPRLANEPFIIDFFETKDKSDNIMIARYVSDKIAKDGQPVIFSGEIDDDKIISFERKVNDQSRVFYTTQRSHMDVDRLYIVDDGIRTDYTLDNIKGLMEVDLEKFYQSKGVDLFPILRVE